MLGRSGLRVIQAEVFVDRCALAALRASALQRREIKYPPMKTIDRSPNTPELIRSPQHLHLVDTVEIGQKC
jgi:hypothetical protein